MQIIKRNISYFLSFFFVLSLSSQERIPNTPQKLSWKGNLTYHYVPSLTEQLRKGSFVPASINKNNYYGKEKRINGNKVIPGKGLPKGLDPLLYKQKNTISKRLKTTSLTFETTNSTSTPSDPTGAVGRDYYIASWNTAFQIYNKNGTPATPPASLATLFPGNPDGDPIVLYDVEADRYIVTEFEDDPNGFHVAISQSNDPVNGGWHVYSATSFQTGTFPDYTKFSIWSDGYYVTAHIAETDSNGNSRNGQVWALDRTKMLVGDSTAGIQAFSLPGIQTNGFYSPQAFNVTDGNLPAKGNATIVYMQDDAWLGVTYDHLKLWNINVDWNDPENSTISAAKEIPTAPFTGVFDGGGLSNLAQPTGPKIDAMQATIMNQAQFRKFETHNSVVFNFVVNTNETDKHAGIRWYELRQIADGEPWSIYQEGTYTAPDNRNAFGASMAMDATGNIGMGYSSVSETESISLRYTGRFNDDPLNTMTALEELIVQSNSDNPSVRYADYSHLTVDPTNNLDFWFVSEYFNNGNRSNMVGVFRLTPPPPNDVGVISIDNPTNGLLTSSEDITVTIKNFGSIEQSNFPVSYKIDDGNTITELFSKTLSPSKTDSFTFSAKANLSSLNKSYTIEAFTNLNEDENSSNNGKKKIVFNGLDTCIPNALDCDVDGIKKFILEDINVDDGNDGCNSTGSITGYVNRKELITDLDRSRGIPYVLKASHNWRNNPEGESLSAWIDFNDNGIFEQIEQVIIGESFNVANTLQDFDLFIPQTAPLGEHILRVKAIDITSENGDINDPCSDYDFGEVHDYTIRIIDRKSSTDDAIIENSVLDIYTLPNKQYKIKLTTAFNGVLSFRLYDILGQQIVFNNITKNNNEYIYDLNMSYANTGVYIIQIGTKRAYKTVKLIIK